MRDLTAELSRDAVENVLHDTQGIIFSESEHDSQHTEFQVCLSLFPLKHFIAGVSQSASVAAPLRRSVPRIQEAGGWIMPLNPENKFNQLVW